MKAVLRSLAIVVIFFGPFIVEKMDRLNLFYSPIPSLRAAPLIFEISPAVLAFQSLEFGNEPPAQTIILRNYGDAILRWKAAPDAIWIGLNKTGGELLPGNWETITVFAHTDGLPAGIYQSTIAIVSLESPDLPVRVAVTLRLDSRLVRTLLGHTHWVWSVAFSPDVKRLASGSEDSTVKIWDVATGRALYTRSERSKGVHSVAFSPNGRWLASGGCNQGFVDDRLQLWDASTGENISTLQGHTSCVESVAFSPDGSLLVSGGADAMVNLWQVNTHQMIRSLIGHTDVVWSVNVSPDGKLIASGSCNRRNSTKTCSQGETKLWAITTGLPRRSLRSPLNGAQTSALVTSVAFSPDGKWIAAGSRDQTVKLWNPASGEEVATFTSNAGPILSIAFSPNGKLLAAGSCSQPTGLGFFDCAKGEITLWEVSTGKKVATLLGHTNSVRSVSFSPDGKLLASGSGDKTIRVWDVRDLTLSK